MKRPSCHEASGHYAKICGFDPRCVVQAKPPFCLRLIKFNIVYITVISHRNAFELDGLQLTPFLQNSFVVRDLLFESSPQIGRHQIGLCNAKLCCLDDATKSLFAAGLRFVRSLPRFDGPLNRIRHLLADARRRLLDAILVKN